MVKNKDMDRHTNNSRQLCQQRHQKIDGKSYKSLPLDFDRAARHAEEVTTFVLGMGMGTLSNETNFSC